MLDNLFAQEKRQPSNGRITGSHVVSPRHFSSHGETGCQEGRELISIQTRTKTRGRGSEADRIRRPSLKERQIGHINIASAIGFTAPAPYIPSPSIPRRPFSLALLNQPLSPPLLPLPLHTHPLAPGPPPPYQPPCKTLSGALFTFYVN